MSQVKLEAKVREKTGKGVARKLRREGRIPAVLYGHHLENPIALDLDQKEMEHILHTAGRTAIINLTLTGNGEGSHTAMIADWQRDVLGTRLTHVDLKQVAMDEKVHAIVPIVLQGTSPGVKAGGVMEQTLREVAIEALPLDVPAHLDVDVSHLELGGHMTVADLQVPGKVTILAAAEETVAVVHAPRAVVAAEAEAVAAPAPEAAQE